jgi:hypothetical protein
MGRTVRRASVLGVTVLVLAACASSASKPAAPGSGARVIVRSAFAGQPDHGDVYPAVSGDFGEQPHVAAAAKDTPASPSVLYLSLGTGDRITFDGTLEVRYVKTDWNSGRVLHDSWAAGIAREELPLDDADIGIEPFLRDVRIGSRMEIVDPTASGITVFVIDVLTQGAPSASPTG